MKIYNSLTKTKQQFTPLVSGQVGMYVCGITAYDFCHIGHARTAIVFDLVFRWLQHSGYDVKFVRNVTDVDDKIIARAKEQGCSPTELAERFTKAMHEDYAQLNILPPTEEPKATQTIEDMVEFITNLIESGHAYVASSGDVLFRSTRYQDYGCLSGQNLSQLQQGARVALSADKEDALDFVLWKMAKPEEIAWDSPWGLGRPGWHIECSAMAKKHLGTTFDIHGGGADLKFPHHENERAQSEALHGKDYVRYWMHSGFVQVDDTKMSKSLNNFFTIRQVLQDYHPEVLRYFLLATHYRSPINYSLEALGHAKRSLQTLYQALKAKPTFICDRAISKAQDLVGAHKQRFQEAMDDDFNTPAALCVLFELASLGHNYLANEPHKSMVFWQTLQDLGDILGILQQQPESFLQSGLAAIKESEVEALIAKRDAARQNKDYAKADSIRDELQAHGVSLEDKAGVTTWRFDKPE